jgi:rhomboid family GlyGly-CTERM serine protease
LAKDGGNRAFVPTSDVCLVLGLAGLCLLAQAGGERWQELLEYQRVGLEHGQIWRLLSAHLVHLGWAHAVMNLVALALLVSLFGEPGDLALPAGLLLCSALAVDAGLWFLQPQLDWYVGLSGALHGLLAGLLIVNWRCRNQRYVWLIGLLSVKLAWEQLIGPLPMTADIAGGPVVSTAHLYGAAGGALAGFFASNAKRRGAQVQS